MDKINIQKLVEKYPEVDKDTLKLIVIDVMEMVDSENTLQNNN